MLESPTPSDDALPLGSLPSLTHLHAYPHVQRVIAPHQQFVADTIHRLGSIARCLQHPEIHKVFEHPELRDLIPWDEANQKSGDPISFLLKEMGRWNDLGRAFRDAYTKEELRALSHSTLLLIPEMETFLEWASIAETLRLNLCTNFEEPELRPDQEPQSAVTRAHYALVHARASFENVNDILKTTEIVENYLNAELQTVLLLLNHSSMPEHVD